MLYILKVLNNKDRAGVNIKVDTKWQHSVLCLNAIFRPYICVCVCVLHQHVRFYCKYDDLVTTRQNTFRTKRIWCFKYMLIFLTD